jgi:hypothetical protein
MRRLDRLLPNNGSGIGTLERPAGFHVDFEREADQRLFYLEDVGSVASDNPAQEEDPGVEQEAEEQGEDRIKRKGRPSAGGWVKKQIDRPRGDILSAVQLHTLHCVMITSLNLSRLTSFPFRPVHPVRRCRDHIRGCKDRSTA